MSSDNSQFTIEYRILAAAWLYESDGSIIAVRNVKSKLRDRYGIEPPDARYIKAWADKLFTSGSILDKPRSGRPNERGDYGEDVNTSVEEDPKQSIRRRSDELNIPKTTLHRVLTKDLGYKNWKPTKVQFLSQIDHENRVNSCRAILQKYDTPVRKRRLFFTDECAVYAEGKGQVRISMWSKQNPHFWEQVKQHPPTVMVWAAMSAECLIGPFFLEGGVTADNYIQMLRDEFIPALQARRIFLSSHFQQDGAPAHTAIATRNFLTDTFQDRWVGKFGPVPWPARSPDLTSCDNALWGLLKPRIAARKAQNKEDLKVIIQDEFTRFPVETLQKINERTFRRMRMCIELGGLQVDAYD